MNPQALTQRQKAHMERVLRDPGALEKAETWFREDTTDHWRHDRMRRQILPLLKRPATWITFGDGRFGTDAHFLIRHGQEVVATDISEDLLRVGHERGFIGAFAACDAENVPFGDEAFDWAYCKESYHHFPRAPRAFFEMLRVVRAGLVLQEPCDPEPRNLLGSVLVALLRALRPVHGFTFEPSGNYVYSLSRRELAKMLLGVGLTTFFYRHTYDHYLEGVEFETFPGPLARRIQRKIARSELLARLAGVDSGLVTVVVPKKDDVPLFAALCEAGFSRVDLPRNPAV